MSKISKDNKTICSLQFSNGHADGMYTFLTVKEVSEILRISRDTVYRLLDSRKLPFYYIGGCKRVSTDDLQVYLQSCHIEAQ